MWWRAARFRRRRWLGRIDIGQQFRLLPRLLADRQLAGKGSAFFHIDRSRDDIAVERSGAENRHDGLGDNFAGHLSANFNRANMKLAEKLHVGFFANDHEGRAQFPLHFGRSLNSAFSMHCRLPRNLPSIMAERQTTLLLLKSPEEVTCTSPWVRIARLKAVLIL